MCCPDQGSGIFDQFPRNLHIKHDCQIHPWNPWNCLQKVFILISGDQATIDSFFHLLIIQKHLKITSLMQHAVPLDLQNHRCQRTQILLCHIFPEIMIHVHRRLLPVTFHHTGKSIQLNSIIFQHLYPFDRLFFSSLHKNSLLKPTQKFFICHIFPFFSQYHLFWELCVELTPECIISVIQCT